MEKIIRKKSYSRYLDINDESSNKKYDDIYYEKKSLVMEELELTNINIDKNIKKNYEDNNDSKIINNEIIEIWNSQDFTLKKDQSYNNWDESYNNKSKVNYHINIMFLGDNEIYKNSYIKNYIKKNVKNKEYETYIINDYIKEINLKMHTYNGQNKLKIINTYSYNSSYDIKSWYISIKKYIINNMIEYKKLRDINVKLKSNFNSLVDTRIHYAFYFFKDLKISKIQVKYLKKLQKYILIIPVFIMETNGFYNINNLEILSLKEKIQNILNTNELDLFNFNINEDSIVKIKYYLNNELGPIMLNFNIKNKSLTYYGKQSIDYNVITYILNKGFISYFFYQTEMNWNLRILKLKDKNSNDYFNFKILKYPISICVSIALIYYIVKKK